MSVEQFSDTSLLLERMDEFTRLYKKLNSLLLAHFGLTESSLLLFDIIGDEELTLKAITEQSYLDKSTISRQVNSLVSKDMVTKADGEDKRYSYFKLTPEAKQLYHQFREESVRGFADLLASMTDDEQQKLSILLNRVNRLYRIAL